MKANTIESVHITTHSGKLEGMHSISTAVKLNPNCRDRRNIKGSICQKCYAETLTDYRDGLEAWLEYNTAQLTTDMINPLPIINDKYFRLEAFGDLINETQVHNYFRICYANKGTRFALWTKNPWIIASALKTASKPDNLIIVYSSPMINKAVNVKALKKLYPFVDKVFTVYRKAYANEHNVTINCGGNHCLSCLRCYSKRTADTVNELLK